MFIRPQQLSHNKPYISYVIQRGADGERVLTLRLHETALGAKRAYKKRPHPGVEDPSLEILEYGWEWVSRYGIIHGIVL